MTVAKRDYCDCDGDSLAGHRTSCKGFGRAESYHDLVRKGAGVMRGATSDHDSLKADLEAYSAVEKVMSARRRLLTEAADIIDGNRDQQYGTPEDNFARIASLWNALGFRAGFGPVSDAPMAGRSIDPADVAQAMIQVKQARLVSSPGHTDSWRDTAGYAGCGHEVTEGK